MALAVYRGSSDYRGPKCVLTIGNFDGVHRGHQALIRKNQDKAAKLDIASVLYTFEPHPRRVLQPNNQKLASARQTIYKSLKLFF